MRINSLELYNFRGFLGEHKIKFASDGDKNLTLILAENEVGKSTLLNGFMWCFYGFLTADTDVKDELIHDEASDSKAHVSVQIQEGDKEFLFKRSIYNKDINFKAWEIDDIGEMHPRHHPEALINTFLPKTLSDYFLFNGEGLKDIIKDASKLETSIQNIQGLNAAAQGLENIGKYKVALMAESKRSKKKAGDIETKKSDLKKNIELKNGADKKLSSAQEKLVIAKDKFKAAKDAWEDIKSFDAKELNTNKEACEKRIDIIKNQIEGYQSSRRLLISKYGIDIIGYSFTEEAAVRLSEAGERGYPSKYHKQIIRDSLEDDECKLCERDFKKDQKIKDLLKNKIAIAVDEDLTSRIGKTNASIGGAETALKNFTDELETLETNINKAEINKSQEESVLNDLNAKIEKIAGKDKEVKKVKDNFTKRLDERSSASTDVGKAQSDSEYFANEEKRLMAEILKLESDVNPGSKMETELKFLDECIDELDNLIQEQEKSGRDFIFTDMNESLKKHSKGNHQFRFEEDTYNPVILKSDGITKVKLSMGGKKLKKNLFFITSLIKHSKMRSNASGSMQIPGTIAPLVVDAPFSDLDQFNISIAARVLLESSDQLVVMISSASFNGGFLEVLKEDKSYEKRLGKTYVLKKHFKGPKGAKPSLDVNAFNNTISTAVYDSKHETSEIEEINFGK